MSAMAILAEMLATLDDQVEAVVSGDHSAVQSGAELHERHLSALQNAEIDGTPEQIRGLCARVEQKKTKLHSLLAAESVRTDFLLRLILAEGPVGGGYPTTDRRQQGRARMLNQRA